MVCKSKEEGGLGVLNLKTQSEALLLKHLNKFFNKEDIPWVSLVWESYYDSDTLLSQGRKGSFWWRDILKLLDKFKGMAKVNINNGKSCYLWLDMWDDKVPKQVFLELFSFAKSQTSTLAVAKRINPLSDLFHLPLSEQAYSQFLQLDSELQQLTLNDDSDKWSYLWSSGKFFVAKAYKHLSVHSHIHSGFKWVWSSSCQNKHKVFDWLIMKDRLSTRELLKRKNMELQDYNCVLCNNRIEESLLHLMLLCPFSQACWAWLNCHVILQDLYRNIESFKV